MYYTIYKTTNKINGKIYIGAHQTKNLDDGYLGSGKLLIQAIIKYKKENFEKEILEIFDNKEEMFSLERKIVNKFFIESEDNYNLKIGGEGGGQLGINLGKIRSEEFKENLRIIMTGKRLGIESPFKGCTQSVESLEMMKKTMYENNHQQGGKNSQYGTMWIHNLDLKESKKIKKEQFPEYESLGWLKGRKIKWKDLSQLTYEVV